MNGLCILVRKMSRGKAMLAASLCLLGAAIHPVPSLASTNTIPSPSIRFSYGPDSGGIGTFTARLSSTASAPFPATGDWLAVEWTVNGSTISVPSVQVAETTTAVSLPTLLPVGTYPITVKVTNLTTHAIFSVSGSVAVVEPPSTPGAKVTGGGWIITQQSEKGTFGMVAMAKDAATARGNLTYQDHGLGMMFKSTEITAVTVSGVHARIFGRTMINNSDAEYNFVVDLDDNGEPGAGVDTWGIQVNMLENGLYVAGGDVTGGGNLQVHK